MNPDPIAIQFEKAGVPAHVGAVGSCGEYFARAILYDPQAHIDALVEAGVLRERTATTDGSFTSYVVVQPHEHDWRIRGLSGVMGNWKVTVACFGCDSQEVRSTVDLPRFDA